MSLALATAGGRSADLCSFEKVCISVVCLVGCSNGENQIGMVTMTIAMMLMMIAAGRMSKTV